MVWVLSANISPFLQRGHLHSNSANAVSLVSVPGVTPFGLIKVIVSIFYF